MDKKYYTGIGSREVPPEIAEQMTKIARYLRNKGYTLRSGHAEGSDMAFELGSMADSDIYLPWSGFNKEFNMPLEEAFGVYQVPKFTALHLEILSDCHPKASALQGGIQKLHMRNINQLYGKDVENPVFSEFVICWTPYGAEDYRSCSRDTGGTLTAIRAASLKMIPIFNLKNDNCVKRLKEYLKI
jgi:hypothetical protein